MCGIGEPLSLKALMCGTGEPLSLKALTLKALGFKNCKCLDSARVGAKLLDMRRIEVRGRLGLR